MHNERMRGQEDERMRGWHNERQHNNQLAQDDERAYGGKMASSMGDCSEPVCLTSQTAKNSRSQCRLPNVSEFGWEYPSRARNTPYISGLSEWV
jgi:hypothetical protein